MNPNDSLHCISESHITTSSVFVRWNHIENKSTSQLNQYYIILMMIHHKPRLMDEAASRIDSEKIIKFDSYSVHGARPFGKIRDCTRWYGRFSSMLGNFAKPRRVTSFGLRFTRCVSQLGIYCLYAY